MAWKGKKNDVAWLNFFPYSKGKHTLHMWQDREDNNESKNILSNSILKKSLSAKP